MEQHQDQHNENNGLSVEVNSQKFISGKKKDAKKALEDTNCNLTILNSQSNEVLTDGEIIKSCEKKLSLLSLNGPTKLSNGIENSVESDCSSLENTVSKKISSQCETCVKASENPNVSAVVNSIDDKNRDSEHSLIKSSQGVNISADGKENPQALTDVTEGITDSPVHDDVAVCAQLSDSKPNESPQVEIKYVSYESEVQMPDIMRLIQKDLSEPYSIYTYRYFIHNWPQLCFLVS